MLFKTEKNFVRIGIALWVAFVLCDIATIGAVFYVVCQFVSKFW